MLRPSSCAAVGFFCLFSLSWSLDSYAQEVESPPRAENTSMAQWTEVADESFRIELVEDLVRENKSLRIKKYTPLASEDRMYRDHYWKVYFQGDNIIGEELYVNQKLSYFVVYWYEKEKIFQRGFYWNGIITEIVPFFFSQGKIKQGYLYSAIPDMFKVYQRDNLDLIYQGFFQLYPR